MPHRRPNGPIEDHANPATIEARVVTTGSNPRLHGFSVEDDLALHYRYPELVLLALTGSPPDEMQGRAFDVALQFLALVGVADAPTHAAVLARICGAPPNSVLAVAWVCLAERARHLVAEKQELLQWLTTSQGELPPRCRGQTEEDRLGVDRLRNALAAAGANVPGLNRAPNRWTAIFITLHFAGLRRAEQWEAVLVMASIAPVLAEAMAHSPGAFDRYPIDSPPFVYEEDS
jgi:hypothetical protein